MTYEMIYVEGTGEFEICNEDGESVSPALFGIQPRGFEWRLGADEFEALARRLRATVGYY